MMKKTVYEAPHTERFQVELEGVFCASANVQNPNDTTTGQIEGHGVNEGFVANFSSGSWDVDPTASSN